MTSNRRIGAAREHVGGDPTPWTVHLGYQDFAAGRGYDRRYANASEQWQRNYESGRAVAAAIIGAGLVLPAWPVPTRLPKAVHEAWLLSGAYQVEPLPACLPADPLVEAKAAWTRRGFPLPVPEMSA